MTAPRTTPQGTADETGAVLVMFAVFASLAILMLAFVLDMGNWFEHQRHLQLQADAAAQAAASAFAYPCTKQAKEGLYEQAALYGGVRSVITPEGTTTLSPEKEPLNQQVGGVRKGNVYEQVNKRTFYEQPFENKPSEATTVEKAPCDPEASMVDVKMTETGLPWFFKALNVPYINAHARVSIKAETTASGVEPLIESEPIEARVLFVNDNPDGSKNNYNNELLATGLLTNIGSNEEKGTIKWSNWNPATKLEQLVALKVTKPHIGVRIALAGKAGALTGAGNEGVSVCTHAYVECFDEDSGIVPPLVNISGYSKEGEGTAVPLAPVAHKVALSNPSPDTCTDAYFNNFPGSEPKATCTMTISAELQYGKESANATGVTVTPEFVYTEGFSNKTEKVKQPPLQLEGGVWTDTTSPARLPSYLYGNFGSTEINLVVSCKPEPKSPCEKAGKTESVTLKDVQRAFTAGPDGSNRIVAATVFEPGAANPVPGERDANAFEICEKADAEKCEHKLGVTVELKGSLEDAKKYFNKESAPSCASEKVFSTPSCHAIPPFHVLQADNDQDGDDQFVVSCPPTVEEAGVLALYDEALAHGCAGKYSVNTQGGSCASEHSAQEKIKAEETAEKEAREKQEAAKAKREKEEAAARKKWEEEEKSKKITKAQREAKEAEQTTARAAAEKAEQAATQKREAEEKATQEAKAKAESAAHECVGLVPVEELSESELTANFENYLAKRIENPVNGLKKYCPNEWSNNNEGGIPTIKANDSRLVQFFVVPFTVTNFQRKSEATPLVPIVNFATFYVTGWPTGNTEAGQGKKEWNPKERRDECSEKLFKKLPAAAKAELEDETKPLKEREQKEKEKGFDDNTEQPREILGHLVKYVNVLGEGSGAVACKQESYETCEAKLTE